MRTDVSDLSEATRVAVSTAGELMIRAVAAIGRLSQAERDALSQASEGKVEECLVWALEGAAKVSPAIRESLRTHPPEGIKVFVESDVQRPRHTG